MASISRVAMKDLKSSTCHSFHRPSSGLSSRTRLQTNLDPRAGFCGTENGRFLAIQSKARSPIVALCAVSLCTKASRQCQVICNAAANVSGDVPNSTPTEMSAYEKIIETLTTLFPVWVSFWARSCCSNLVGDGPIHSWLGFPHAIDGIDSNI